MRIVLLVAVGLMLAGPSRAESYTAQKWASDCRSAGFDTGYCYGYVRSATDHNVMITVAVSVAKDLTYEQAAAYCPPKGVTLGQLVEIGKKHIAENPAEWHEPVMYVLRDAWAKAFPCPAK